MNARNDILARVAAAAVPPIPPRPNHQPARPPTPAQPQPAHPATDLPTPAQPQSAHPATDPPTLAQPQSAHSDGGASSIELFQERLAEYRATVTVCTEVELAGVLGGLLAQAQTLVVPPGVPREWLSAYPRMMLVDGESPLLSASELDGDAVSVLTGCAVAIAQTGTLVLDAGPDQGRRLLTLVPDHHVCVVRSGQIVDGVPEAFAAIADPTRPLTFISGPSATSDIELARVEGVHGPRRLDVVIVQH